MLNTVMRQTLLFILLTAALSHSKTVIVSIYQSTRVPKANFVNELFAVCNDVNTSHLIDEWKKWEPLNLLLGLI
jgi:hypothetical protein